MPFSVSTLLLIFLLSFLAGTISLYFLRKWAIINRFLAIPNDRSSHEKLIPNIAGTIFYLAIPGLLFISERDVIINSNTLFISASILVFLFLGLADDKWHTRATIKFLFQLVGTALFIKGTGWLIQDFFNLLHFNTPISYVYTLIFALAVINAFNMMDGIDGLAGMLVLSILVPTGIVFYQLEDTTFLVFTLSLSGLLLAFLFYNFSKKYKMLMGDTGSLFLGLLLAILVIKGLQNQYFYPPPITNSSYNINSYILFSLISIPLFDFFRVFLVRIFRGDSPFRADQNHIHHLLTMNLQLSHAKASILIVLANMLIVLGFYMFMRDGSGLQYLLTYGFLFLLYCGGVNLVKRLGIRD